MTLIDRAMDLVAQGETAIVLLTRGDLLAVNENGTGTTGHWKFNPHSGRRITKVIIYFEDSGSQIRKVFVADYAGAICPIEVDKYHSDGRWVIRLTGFHEVGTTQYNWKRFADAGTNPVRFLSKPTRR